MFRVFRVLCSLSLAAGAGAGFAACDGVASLRSVEQDEGDGSGNYGSPGQGGEVHPITTRIREDFDNTRFIASTYGAVHDINQGVITLVVPMFPKVKGTGVWVYSAAQRESGVVEGQSIVVGDEADILAPDAIEYRAQDILHIVGTVRAGPGGATLISEGSIFVDGDIDSDGPVRVMLSNPLGRIEISGRITSRAAKKDASGDPAILLEGRGSVAVRGQLLATARDGQSGGVEIHTYGPIEVVGATAQIASSGIEQGAAGPIILKSEACVSVTDGASLGGAIGGPASLVGGGASIDVRAEHVRVGVGSHIKAGSSTKQNGGYLHISAGDALIIEASAELRSGDGRIAGEISLSTSSASFGPYAVVAAGHGEQGARETRIATAGDLAIGDGATIAGGAVACARGGQTTLAIAGTITVAAGVTIEGGPSTGLGIDNTDCTAPGLHAGGDASVSARAVVGPLQASVRGGTGGVAGTVHIVVDPAFVQPRPTIATGPSGWVISKVLDRGPEASEQVPKLIAITAVIPPGTGVSIQLAGSDAASGPFETWYDVREHERALLAPLVGARFLRYRAILDGRAFDAPVLDSFEISLDGGD